MSTMKGKGKADKYVVRVDVATSPVHQRRHGSRASMVSSDGSVIQDIESQFQFELGRTFFEKAVHRAERQHSRANSASSVRSGVPSLSSQVNNAYTQRYRTTSLSERAKIADRTPVDVQFLPADDDDESRFEEYIVNGCLDPTAVSKKRALAQQKKQSELEESEQIKISTQDLLFDDEFASEVLSELNLDQVDLTEGNLAELVAQRLIESGLVVGDELAVAQNPAVDGQEIKGQGDQNEAITPGERAADKGGELSVNQADPDNATGPLESQKGEIDHVKTDEAVNDKSAQATEEPAKSSSSPEGKEPKAEECKGNVNEEDKSNQKETSTPTDDSKDETASVSKKSDKSTRSKSGRSKKIDKNKKVTFVEEPDVKKMTPRSAKSPKGKKARSATGKKGGKSGKGDKKGKKKSGKGKSPTPPPSETDSQPEPTEKPPEEAAVVEPEIKEEIPEEPKVPEKIILDEPPQYCLASEYKSKEQMVREWLHGCNTNAAIRTHPIL